MCWFRKNGGWRRYRNIQTALEVQSIDPWGVDGKCGPKTVAAFQRINGLVVDGEVGPQTARVLEVEL